MCQENINRPSLSTQFCVHRKINFHDFRLSFGWFLSSFDAFSLQHNILHYGRLKNSSAQRFEFGRVIGDRNPSLNPARSMAMGLRVRYLVVGTSVAVRRSILWLLQVVCKRFRNRSGRYTHRQWRLVC